jgi:hypothetical protein
MSTQNTSAYSSTLLRPQRKFPHLLKAVENRRTGPRLSAATVVAVRAVLVRELGETGPRIGGDVGAVAGEDRVDVVEGRGRVLREGKKKRSASTRQTRSGVAQTDGGRSSSEAKEETEWGEEEGRWKRFE